MAHVTTIVKRMFRDGSPVVSSMMVMLEEKKAAALACLKFLKILGRVDAMTASPAMCDGDEPPCQTPPGGLTAAWNAIVAMRITTTIITSLILP